MSDVREKYFVGVDVGTGSARAALLSTGGKVLRLHVRPTQTWNPLPDHYEQSSDGIWTAVCECVKVESSKIIIMKLYRVTQSLNRTTFVLYRV